MVEVDGASSTKHLTEHNVLGVHWNVSSDQLVFRLDAMKEAITLVEPTKRAVISLIGRIYDPLGFLFPVTVHFKLLMQDLCKSKHGWNRRLDGELLVRWMKLCNVVKVGDIVLVHDQDNPRGFWKMARVQELIIGRDHRVRGVF